ncbi:MAG: glycosyltransferase 87 family protein [Streptosporangiaceae bacterium]
MIAATVVGVVVATAAVTPNLVHWLTNVADQRLVDLDVYRTSGQAVLRGASVYDFVTEPPQLLPFTYPPFAALLAVPLALVSWPVAQGLMTALILVALTITVGYGFRPLISRFGDWSPAAWGVLVGLMSFALPVSDQFRFGQVDLFLVAMCVADCATKNPRWPRGLLVGLATAVKLVPGVFLVYLLVTGRRDAAWNAVLTAAAATLFTLGALPGDSVDFWFGALWDNSRVGSNNGTANQAFRGFLLRMYWPDPVTSLVWLLAVALLAYFGFRYARRASLLAASGTLAQNQAWSAEMTGIALTGLLAVLVSPIAWIHHLAWIVLVVGALAGDGRDRARCGAAAGVWLFYVLTIPWWGLDLIAAGNPGWERALGRIVQSSYALGAVALVFVLGIWLIGRIKAGSSRVPGVPSPNPAGLGTLAP